MRPFRKNLSFKSTSSPSNQPPGAPTSPIIEYIKELHPRTKDRSVLCASSSAIALAIASPSSDIALRESESSKEPIWRTVYGAVKIAVEIARDCSDALPMVKAVMAALSVLIKYYDQTTANAELINDIEERIRSLGGILAYPVGNGDNEENARREVLRKKLSGIIAKLEPLSERHGLVKFLRSDDHANALSGFVQDLAQAVTDYQTSIQQSILGNTRRIGEDTRNIIEAADLELLEKLGPVHNAGYQAGHHDTCLRGTRESVLDRIMRWSEDPQDRHVFWLNGLAGTGKSTIAQTFSKMAAETGCLGASFFCSRDYLDRKELKNIFPTLAYQLACRYPEFRSHIIRVVKRDPSIAHNSLISQLQDLIVDPLSSVSISCAIVVDALDECVDDQPASAILSVLGRFVKQLPFVKFFITGRPEPRIRSGFRLPLLEPITQIFLLHKVEPSSVDEDIRLYLQKKLTALATLRSDFDLSNPWPSDKELMVLTKKSSGLFIFASTLARFIESEHHEPKERLHLVISSAHKTHHEGRAGIDPLYTQVLTHAFLDIEEIPVFENFRRVLGAVVLAFNPLSRLQIAKIFGINQSLITTTLRHLHSVLLVPNEESKEIRVFHKSFPDFLQDSSRCSDPRFFIHSPAHHCDMALGCLELLKELKSNPCSLPDFIMNRDVGNLQELLEDKVGSATRYACGYWAMHIRSSQATSEQTVRLVNSAVDVFKNNAIPWIEIMSLDNKLESVIHSIYTLFDWLADVSEVSTSDLSNRAQDCLRFTMHFFHLIQQSASHIYHSALPLSSKSSMFRSLISQEKTRIIEFYGCPASWGVVVRTIKGDSGNFTYVTTFGHRIAAACDDGTVGIYDTVTGVLRLSLKPANSIQALRGSPDGSVLFCMHQKPSITLWDIQTGGLVHTFDLEQNAGDIAVSLNGHYLACGLADGSVGVWEVENRTKCAAIKSGSPVTHICGLDPEEQFVIATKASVYIWDVVSGIVLHSFTMSDPVCGAAYSKKLNQLAIMASSELESTITIIDPQTGASSAPYGVQRRFSCFTFSRTTKELVCGMEAHGLQLFNALTWRWRYFEYPGSMSFISSLPNGTMVASVAGSGIQLLSLEDGNPPPQQTTISALAVRALDGGKIIAVLPTSHDSVVFLESTTMSPLFTIPPPDSRLLIPADLTIVLCASLEYRMAIYCFKEGQKRCLRLWRFDDEFPKWSADVEGMPQISEISPGGTRLVTYDELDYWVHVCVWDTQEGRILVQNKTRPRLKNALRITFESEDRFFIHYDAHCIPHEVSLSGTDILITRRRKLPSDGRPQEIHHCVDETREWVLHRSRRISWIPTGYIGSDPHSYCWTGHSLVMVGQDETLRKLTFRGLA